MNKDLEIKAICGKLLARERPKTSRLFVPVLKELNSPGTSLLDADKSPPS